MLTVLPSIPKNALILLAVSRAPLNKNGVPFDTTASISLLESNLHYMKQMHTKMKVMFILSYKYLKPTFQCFVKKRSA